MIKRWIATVFAAIVFLVGLGSYKFLEIKSAIDAVADQPEYSEAVQAGKPAPAEHTPTVTVLGVAVAPQLVTLRNELPGYITAVNFVAGATVKRGDVIIQLDVSEQLANLASAKARARLAESVYNRDVKLRKSDFVSEAKAEQSLSEWNALKADIAAIRSIINRRTIRAPFDGVIGIHQFQPGQYLEANTEITTLVGTGKQMWIDFSLPQFYGELEIDTKVRARLVRGQQGVQSNFFYAIITAGDPIITPGSRSRRYRAAVTDENVKLLHNASLEVEVPVGQQQALSTVPAQSIRRDAGGEYVFVLDPEADNEGAYRARRVPVSVQGEDGENAYVAGSFTTDDLIALAGSFKLRPGLLVRVNTRPVIAVGARG